MLDIQPPLREQRDFSGFQGTEAEERQTTKTFLLHSELAEAAKAVEIAQAQEKQVGARRTTRGGQPQKYILTDEGRQLILAHYDSQPATISWLVEQISTPEHPIPRWQIGKWARELGVARLKEPFWSEPEVAYLRNSLRRYGLKKIARALGRTETSVKLKAKRLGVRKLVTGDGYTMRAVCRGLGVDHHQVERWLANEWFWGERRESRRHGRQRGDIWYFTAEAIQFLAREHPEEVDLRRVDRQWLIEVLLGPPQSLTSRPVPALPRQAARSIYAFLSGEAHSLLVTHYTGGLRRTEALAEILGVSPDEVTTWAVLLGLEQASTHHPHVHQQEGRKKRGRSHTRREAEHSLSQSMRHLLELRYTGDPGSTQALADDLGLTPAEVDALAQAAGISPPLPGADGESERVAGTNRNDADAPQEQETARADRIPLQAQLLIAMHYHDEDTAIEQLIEKLAEVLEEASSVSQVIIWARRLGLRTRRKQRAKRNARTPEQRAAHKPARPGAFVPLQLDTGEWRRFLSDDTCQAFLPDNTVPALPTAEEIRLGYQVACGNQEQEKTPGEQEPAVIEAARRAEARLAEVLLPLVWSQALARLGRGVSLEALLAVGRCGLDEAIFRFDYSDPYPLVSVALPAICEEMDRLIANTSPLVGHTQKLRRYARIADASKRLARAWGQPPTLGVVAGAISLSPDLVEHIVRFLVEANAGREKENEVGRGRREKVSDSLFVTTFLHTTGPRSSDIIREMADVLPLTALTVQVRFYELRLHTRIAERDRRREQARLRIEARRAAEPLVLPAGPFLWDVIVDGHKRRWALAAPYGALSNTDIESGSRLFFEGGMYEVSRVYSSAMTVHSVPDPTVSP